MPETATKPDFVTDEQLEDMFRYLDDLRESGETNMFGAGRYLEEMFPEMLARDVHEHRASDRARQVLLYWMAVGESR